MKSLYFQKKLYLSLMLFAAIAIASILIVAKMTNENPQFISAEEQASADWLWEVFPPYSDGITKNKKIWLKECDFIDLPERHISSADIYHFRYVVKLKTLQFVNNESVTKEGFQEIALLPNLEHLSIYGDPLSDSDLRILSQCRNLTSLNFDASDLSNTGFGELANFTRLKFLYLENAEQLTDDDMRFAESLLGLQRIVIKQSRSLTPKCLMFFESLPNLHSVEIYGSPLLPELEVQKFEKDILRKRLETVNI